MKSKCLYCGNHPTIHIEHYLSHTLSAFSAEFFPKVQMKESETLERFIFSLVTPLAFILRVARMYRWQDDPAKALTGRSRVIWEEAQKRGIQMLQLVIFSYPVEFYCAYIHGAWQYFTSLPIPTSMQSGSTRWMDDKFALKKFFLKSGIPVADGSTAWTRRGALEVFEKLRKPVIVKPRFGTHGRHSVTNIRTREECVRAFDIASVLSQCVIVEEHLRGSVYRATYVRGKVLGVLRGDPPRVVGDGTSTIWQLIEKKNASRHPRVGEFPIDEKFTEFMTRQELTVESVPERGKMIDLSEKIGLSYGGYTAEMITKIHPKLLKILTRAGDLLDTAIVGFDFIIEYAEKDPDEQTWGIIEANSQPFIDLHYDPLEGETVNVASAIWDLWEDQK